jgi:hypothetical protein
VVLHRTFAFYLLPFAFPLLAFLDQAARRVNVMNNRPGREAFTTEEWKVIQSCRTPRQAQRFLTAMKYNREAEAATLRSFRGVIRHGEAHCLEAALTAATILEQHGYPPLLMSLESQDKLDHVVFIFQKNGLWGSVARSRDLGLHGRQPVFRSPRQLAWSYFDTYVDYTGRITGYGVANLYALGNYDWRFSLKNVRKVEHYLCEIPHTELISSDRRYKRLLARYREFKGRYPDRHLTDYANRHQWML